MKMILDCEKFFTWQKEGQTDTELGIDAFMPSSSSQVTFPFLMLTVCVFVMYVPAVTFSSPLRMNKDAHSVHFWAERGVWYVSFCACTTPLPFF